MSIPDDAEVRLATVMRYHLPLPLPNTDDVMCMCHSAERRAIFDGPFHYRSHVARLQVEALMADEWTSFGEFAKARPGWVDA